MMSLPGAAVTAFALSTASLTDIMLTSHVTQSSHHSNITGELPGKVMNGKLAKQGYC
jgi:hypothetical protein